MTTEERQAYFDQNGVYPIEDSDIHPDGVGQDKDSEDSLVVE